MRILREDRLAGTLLGVAVGDPDGVAAPHGALVASLFASHPSEDASRVAARFRTALLAWSLRHPWSADACTVRVCGSIALGLNATGVRSPTAGAAPRSTVAGAFLAHEPERRRVTVRALAEVTHADRCSVEAASFAGEVAALAALSSANRDRILLLDRARSVVRAPDLIVRLHLALELAEKKLPTDLAARELGTGALAVEAVPLAAFAFARFGDSPRDALAQLARVPGAHARVSGPLVGAWVGTLLGASCLPWEALARLADGELGASRLRELARGMAANDAPDFAIRSDAFEEQAHLWPKPASGRHTALRRWRPGRFWSGRRAPSTIRG